MRFWARLSTLSLVTLAMSASCGPDASSLSACENVAFKMRLCEVSSPPPRAQDIDFCGGNLSEWERCQLDCWYEASCVEWRQEDPGPDTARCLSNCEDDYCTDCNGTGNLFDCGDGVMLSQERVCDGQADCDDESDETGC